MSSCLVILSSRIKKWMTVNYQSKSTKQATLGSIKTKCGYVFCVVLTCNADMSFVRIPVWAAHVLHFGCIKEKLKTQLMAGSCFNMMGTAVKLGESKSIQDSTQLDGLEWVIPIILIENGFILLDLFWPDLYCLLLAQCIHT